MLFYIILPTYSPGYDWLWNDVSMRYHDSFWMPCSAGGEEHSDCGVQIGQRRRYKSTERFEQQGRHRHQALVVPEHHDYLQKKCVGEHSSAV